MIAGYLSKKPIFQQPIAELIKLDLGSKIKDPRDPTDFVKVKLETPNFANLNCDRNIFAISYNQAIKDINITFSIDQIEKDSVLARENLKNNYNSMIEINLALSKTISNQNDDKIEVEPERKGPYDDIKKSNFKEATHYFFGIQSSETKYEEDIKRFMEAAKVNRETAVFYLDSANRNLENAISLYNNK